MVAGARDRVRLGFIGSGNIAKLHANRIARLGIAELAGFSDTVRDRAAALADAHGGRAYADYREMLDHEKLDGVLLCTPHHARVEPINEIAARKIALFCEKPPAFTLDDAEACMSVIDRVGILNTCGLMYRWSPIADRLKELIAERPVNICQITACWSMIRSSRDSARRKGTGDPWLLKQEISGGPMIDQGIHLIDAVRFILNDDVASVHGIGSNLLEPRAADLSIYDTIMANYQFARGTVGSHVHSWSYTGWVFQIRMIGADFDFLWDIPASRLSGVMNAIEVKYESRDDPYDNELTGFVRAIEKQDQRALRGSFADACRSLAATLAVMESVRSGQPRTVEFC